MINRMIIVTSDKDKKNAESLISAVRRKARLCDYTPLPATKEMQDRVYHLETDIRLDNFWNLVEEVEWKEPEGAHFFHASQEARQFQGRRFGD